MKLKKKNISSLSSYCWPVYVQASPPKVVAEALMNAAEEWAGTPEQADDMTVIVARMN